jgi:hypothetical protein
MLGDVLQDLDEAHDRQLFHVFEELYAGAPHVVAAHPLHPDRWRELTKDLGHLARMQIAGGFSDDEQHVTHGRFPPDDRTPA